MRGCIPVTHASYPTQGGGEACACFVVVSERTSHGNRVGDRAAFGLRRHPVTTYSAAPQALWLISNWVTGLLFKQYIYEGYPTYCPLRRRAPPYRGRFATAPGYPVTGTNAAESSHGETPRISGQANPSPNPKHGRRRS